MSRYRALRPAISGDDGHYEAEFARLRGAGLHPAVAAILAHENITSGLRR